MFTQCAPRRSGIIRGALTGALLFGLIVAASLEVPHIYAEDDTELPSFDFLVFALTDAEDRKLLPNSVVDLLTEWFIEDGISPRTGETPEEVRERLTLPEQSAFRLLVVTLEDADAEGVLSDSTSQLLAELIVERFIVPHTGETTEQVRDRLSENARSTCTGLVSGSKDDCTALVALYEATEGDNWTDNTNWLSSEPLGQWHGVVTDDSGSVIKLDLGDNHLVGEIPPELGRLSNLEILDLQDNQLTGFIPLELGDLHNLTTIILDANRLVGCLPGGLLDVEEISFKRQLFLISCPDRDALVALYEATDGHNWIDNTNWLSNEPIGQWYGVETEPPRDTVERLDGNFTIVEIGDVIVEIEDDFLDHDDVVVGLELSHNGLSGEIPAELGDLTEMTSLSLWGNELNGQIPPEIGSLSKLERLYLHANKLSGRIPAELGRLVGLERLFIGGNRFDGCIPDDLGDIFDTDLSTLGLPFCMSETTTPPPTLTLAAFSLSPTVVSLTWSPIRESESFLEIYRNGELIAAPPSESGFYTDSGLNPNTVYEYQVKLMSADGTVPAAVSDATTLVYPPASHRLMKVTDKDFEVAIVDSLNPTDTEYQVKIHAFVRIPIYYPNEDRIVHVMEEIQPIVLDWSASRCITFEYPGIIPHRLEVFAQNSDGIKSKNKSSSYVYLQEFTGNDDAWARQRIEEASDIYNLTDQARSWMLSDIRVEGMRNEPGYAGYLRPRGVGIGYTVGPGTLMHETMHGFWEHWDGFPEPCDMMNIYTFRRDMAQFMLDFRGYDQAGEPSPWEDWRPFYNYFAGISEYNYVSADGTDMWELLEQGDYDELWGPLYHIAEAEIPSIVAGKLSLIPPTLRPYFKGFLAEGEDTTWREELLWYASLPNQDRRLWNIAYRHDYGDVLYHAPEYHTSPNAPATSIHPQLREWLRNTDRQILVDFINTLEDISCNAQSPCREVWRADFDFWTGYVEQNLYRTKLYLEELSPDIGIELEQQNLDAVRAALRILVSDVSYCGQTAGVAALRESVNAIAGLSDLQRNALLAMTEIPERNGFWNLPCAE